MTTIDHVPALNGAGPSSDTAHVCAGGPQGPITTEVLPATTNGRAVASTDAEDALRRWLTEREHLFTRALEHLHGGERGADLMGEEACRRIAHAVAPLELCVSEAAFVIATDRYPPSKAHPDPAREQAKAFLVAELGCSKRTADYACQQVDLVALLSINKTGLPTIQHLNAIVRCSDLGDSGWAKVNAWVIRKRGFGNVSPAAVSDYCRRVKKEARAEAARRATLPADPHEPAGAEAPPSAASRLVAHLDDYTAWVDHLTVLLPEAAADDLDAVLAERPTELLRELAAVAMRVTGRDTDAARECFETEERDMLLRALKFCARELYSASLPRDADIDGARPAKMLRAERAGHGGGHLQCAECHLINTVQGRGGRCTSCGYSHDANGRGQHQAVSTR